MCGCTCLGCYMYDVCAMSVCMWGEAREEITLSSIPEPKAHRFLGETSSQQVPVILLPPPFAALRLQVCTQSYLASYMGAEGSNLGSHICTVGRLCHGAIFAAILTILECRAQCHWVIHIPTQPSPQRLPSGTVEPVCPLNLVPTLIRDFPRMSVSTCCSLSAW